MRDIHIHKSSIHICICFSYVRRFPIHHNGGGLRPPPQQWGGRLRRPPHCCGIHYGGWWGGEHRKNTCKYVSNFFVCYLFVLFTGFYWSKTGKTYANRYRIFMYMYISHILRYFPYVIPGAIWLAKSGCLYMVLGVYRYLSLYIYIYYIYILYKVVC